MSPWLADLQTLLESTLIEGTVWILGAAGELRQRAEEAD